MCSISSRVASVLPCTNTNNCSIQRCKHNIVNMIIPINWLNYFVAIYRYMKMIYHNHDMEDYIDYHDIQYILHITKKVYYIIYVQYIDVV